MISMSKSEIPSILEFVPNSLKVADSLRLTGVVEKESRPPMKPTTDIYIKITIFLNLIFIIFICAIL